MRANVQIKGSSQKLIMLAVNLFFNRFHPKQGCKATETEGVTGYGRVRYRNIAKERDQKKRNHEDNG